MVLRRLRACLAHHYHHIPPQRRFHTRLGDWRVWEEAEEEEEGVRWIGIRFVLLGIGWRLRLRGVIGKREIF